MQYIKLLASALLILSFFLPMSSCSYTVPINLDEDETAAGDGTITIETRTSIIYAREFADLNETGAWLNILAFTWPLLLIGFERRFAGSKHHYLLTGSGVLLSVYSAVVVYTWADIGKPLVGAYVGGGAAVALFTIYVIESVVYLRGRLSGKGNVESGKERFEA